MDIAEFLSARLNEDEQVARAATSGPWRNTEPYPGQGAVDSPSGNIANENDQGDIDPADTVHIARHDPARVLAEVAAKRAILNRVHHAIQVGVHSGDQNYVSCSCGWERELVAAKDWDMFADPHHADVGFNEPLRGDVLRALVQPYAGHPDFDPAWSATSAV